MPISIGTSAVFGPDTAVFIKKLGHQLMWVTGDDLSNHHLVQRLSVAIQRENYAIRFGVFQERIRSMTFCLFFLFFLPCLCSFALYIVFVDLLSTRSWY